MKILIEEEVQKQWNTHLNIRISRHSGFYCSKHNICNITFIKSPLNPPSLNPPSLNLPNGLNNQISIDLPREDSAISLKTDHLELDFNVTQGSGGPAWNADGDHIGLVNLDPFALFKKDRLTSSS